MSAALLPLLLACRGDPPPPPDVVLLVVDTERADHLSIHGHERPTSPFLEAVAREGVVFDHALAHSGWTLASTVSLLTGLYPSEHEAVRHPDDALRFGRLAPGQDTLATLLKAGGYATGAFVNNVYLAPEFGVQAGFDRYDYDGAGGVEERSAEKTVDLALSWLGTTTGPTFTYIHLMEPHIPYLPPEHLRRRFTGPGQPLVPVPFCDGKVLEQLMNREWVPTAEQQEYIRKMYDEEILAADEALGRLVRGLAEAGRWDRTLLVYTSDHGEEFWDHGGFEHGHSMFGEVLRVPLVVKGLDLGRPGAPKDEPRPPPESRGARVAVPVQHADVFRTILAVTGAPVPPASHGEDLRRVFTDPSFQDTPRPILSEDCLYGPPLVAVTSGEWRFILNIDNKVANLWRVDAYGQSDTIVPDQAVIDRVARPLYDALISLRGDAKKRPPPRLTAAVDEEGIEKLRALGYVQ